METIVKLKSAALETRRIRLREIQEEDLTTLFRWRNSEKFRLLFHHNDKEIDYEGFREEFGWDTMVRKFQYLVVIKDSHEPAGIAFVHSYSQENKECFLNIFLAEPFERKGYGTDVFVLYVLFLFHQIGIKKLFVEASAYNKYSLSCIRSMGMTEITGLNNKIVLAGKEYDLFRFECDNKFLPRLTKINDYLSGTRQPEYLS